MGDSMSNVRKLWVSLCLGIVTGITTLSGCGDSPNETIVTTNSNTPLIITNVTGLRGYTVGGAQTYSATVQDPDGIASVSVTLDGNSLPVTNVGNVYSITVPANFAVGTHALVFNARGKSSDGTLEIPLTEGLSFTVYGSNTPLTIGAVQGLAAFTIGAAQTYGLDVVDPDGISGVTAFLNDRSIAVTQVGSRYSVSVPANTAAGNYTLRFDGIGKQPDATNESVKSSQLAFIVYPGNTPLVTGSISGLTSYTVGGSQTYSLIPVDPDGIASVTATLDGIPVTLSASNGLYSFSTSTNLSAGNHAISFTATGRLPNGTAENSVVVSQNITVLNSNTPLTLGAISGAASYTVGNVQTYSTNVADPDGIVSVTAVLDTTALTVVNSGASYSVTLPNTVTTGQHTVQFTAIGRRPDGIQETAQVVTQNIQVLPQNTPLQLSSVVGLASYVVGNSATYSVTATDPDGTPTVTATFDNQPIGVSNSGTQYSINIPTNAGTGPHSIVFTGRGRTPGGGQEADQTVSFSFTIFPQNTPLSLGAISGPTSYTQGAITTYSSIISDVDGIANVSATIDNVTVNITNSGSTYSVQTPANLATGAHTLSITAIGQIPGGTREAEQTVTIRFNVQAGNTLLTMSAISGPTSLPNPFGPYTYSTTIVDPDGISSVTADMAGFSFPVTRNSDVYSISVDLETYGPYRVTFTAVGLTPNITPEATQIRTLDVVVNTPLYFGDVVGPFFNQNLGFAITSVVITDPNGISSVTARDRLGTLQVVDIRGNPISVFVSGATYYVRQRDIGISTPVFTAIGLNPDGSQESPQSTLPP
jgi:hypothetical protein